VTRRTALVCSFPDDHYAQKSRLTTEDEESDCRFCFFVSPAATGQKPVRVHQLPTLTTPPELGPEVILTLSQFFFVDLEGNRLINRIPRTILCHI